MTFQEDVKRLDFRLNLGRGFLLACHEDWYLSGRTRTSSYGGARRRSVAQELIAVGRALGKRLRQSDGDGEITDNVPVLERSFSRRHYPFGRRFGCLLALMLFAEQLVSFFESLTWGSLDARSGLNEGSLLPFPCSNLLFERSNLSRWAGSMSPIRNGYSSWLASFTPRRKEASTTAVVHSQRLSPKLCVHRVHPLSPPAFSVCVPLAADYARAIGTREPPLWMISIARFW